MVTRSPLLLGNEDVQPVLIVTHITVDKLFAISAEPPNDQLSFLDILMQEKRDPDIMVM